MFTEKEKYFKVHISSAPILSLLYPAHPFTVFNVSLTEIKLPEKTKSYF